ncbi:hypothetical protein LZD60_06855 [Clostridium perfringens]|nr:hypothetical protein LZD60_06855 [Clostridium perfringens]
MGALEVAQGVQEVLLEVQVRVVLIILVKSILSLVVHLVKRKKAKEIVIIPLRISLINLHQEAIQVLIK